MKEFYDSYEEYMQSEDWRIIRQDALERAGFRCDECESEENLEVHHKTYKNMGNEKDEDLQVLCKECHDEKHSKN